MHRLNFVPSRVVPLRKFISAGKPTRFPGRSFRKVGISASACLVTALVWGSASFVVMAKELSIEQETSVTVPNPRDFNQRLALADDHFNNNRIHDNFSILNDLYVKGVRDPELLWRYARSHYDLAMETTKKDESERLTNEGLALILSAKTALPNNFNVYKWHGILLGKKGEFLSTKEKIANAYTIRDNFAKAIELSPNDATSLYCMGSWCWNIVQISWVERQAASLLFGTPPTSSFEECEAYLLKAWSYDPEGIYIALLLGDMYASKKRADDAKMWYKSASACPAVTENQKRQVADAKARASKL